MLNEHPEFVHAIFPIYILISEERTRKVGMPAQCVNFVATAFCKCSLSGFVASCSRPEVNFLEMGQFALRHNVSLK